MVFNRFLKSKKLFMLFVLPFLAAGLILLNYSGIENFLSLEKGKEVLPIGWAGISPLASAVISGSLVLLQAYCMFAVNARYKFLTQTTTLPALCYVLLTASIIGMPEGNFGLQIAVFWVAWAYAGLSGAIHDSQSNSPLFNLGFFCCLAVLFYPKAVLLLAWGFGVLFFSGRSTLKDITALLLGILTPLFFVAFYYFWTDSLGELPGRFREAIVSGVYLRELSVDEMVRFGCLLILLLLSLYNVVNAYSALIVSQRRGLLSLLSMLFFLVLNIFVIPGITPDFMYLLAFPLAYLYSQYFITYRRHWIGDVVFLLFLVGCMWR